MQHNPTSPQYRHSDASELKGAGAAAPSEEERELPFVFSGRGGEYFRIWIVNMLLTWLTLGIYSAWAKVRNKQYFYGNTSLDGASFSYTAQPQKILVGRLIAAALLGFYILADSLSVAAGMVMFLLLVVATPWIVCQSMRFNARYSRYRNVAFDFTGRPWEAAKAYVLWHLAGAVTLGLLMPLAVQRQQRFMVARHRFGTSDFQFHADVKGYYGIFLAAAGVFLGALILAGVVTTIISVSDLSIGTGWVWFAMALVYMAIVPGVTAAMANRRYNNTTLEAYRMQADWSVLAYVGIVLSNTLLTILTLGLFYPWGKVRLARYKARHTRVFARGDLDHFVQGEREKAGPVAEGVSDLFDFDIGL